MIRRMFLFVGLARWDVLENHEDPGRPSILVMPTWRSWLEYLDDEEFRKSEYYRRYTSLIQNRELLDLLKDRGAELIFYIHPKLSRYMKNFHTDSSLVKLISFGGGTAEPAAYGMFHAGHGLFQCLLGRVLSGKTASVLSV